MDSNQSEAAPMEAQEDHLIKSKVEGDMQLKQVPDKTQHAKEFIHNEPFSSEVMPNGNGLAEDFSAAGNTHINGSLSLAAPPQSTSSPVNSQTQEPSPGLAAFPPMVIERSEGARAEITVHTGDSLQSLRLSMPLQETDLSNQKPSLEMENEEKIRLDARRRLEDQLKQYRVQRHKESSHRTTPKNRPFSTLDPELMLHPEGLPRANTLAMTTEYSFMRTTVPRGPKVGSLGIPPSKDKKPRSPRPSNIHSLADYQSPGSDGASWGAGRVGAADNTMSSHQSTLSSVSTLSAVSVMSEGSTCETEAQPGASLQIGDNASEINGSESGAKPGNDGNDSDSSSYSSVSTRATYGMLSAAVQRQQGPYTVEGREIAPEAMGQFPSLQEVLQVASEEQHLLELEREQDREGMGEPQSRRDSFSSSVSLESSVMGHDDMLQVLKEKMRLEGQLESLSSEANQALKERTELQAQLATVNARLQAKTEDAQVSQEKQNVLTAEVGTLRKNCNQLEKAMVDLQGSLEGKNASLTSLSNDLKVAEDQYKRLMGKVEKMQNTVTSRDITVQELRQQLGGLQSQLQQIQLERSTLQSRMKTSQAEIQSLQQLRQWYQQQLALAQEARVRLQSEMATMQAGQMTQIGTLEHFKLENVTLSHQLTESQHRSIKEKERIAVQLQNIETDMLTQEADYKQIQDAKNMVEDDLQQKLDEFEDERERLIKLANTASTLERDLEQAKLIFSQKDMQLQSLQKEHLELMRHLTTTQDSLQTKEQSINHLEAQYLELEAQLAELQTENSAKDDNIQYLQNEKIVLEVALQAARSEKSQLDEGAERLGEDVLVASDILDQLRQEVQIKANQIETLQQENSSLKRQTQKLKEQFQQQKVMVEAYRRDASSKDQLINELKSTKKRLLAEVKDLKQEVLSFQGEKQSAELEQARLAKEVVRVQGQMNHMEAHLQTIQEERDQLENQIQTLQFDQSQLAAVTEENEGLRKQVEQFEGEAKKAIREQKVRVKRLGTDLTSAQKDMKAKHKAYENAVGILSRRLQEALTDKETAEAELAKLKAQVSDGGNSQAFQDKIKALQAELQTVANSKTMLEKELQEVITLTSTELEDYQEKVMELEDELQESRCFMKRIRKLEDANKKLALELEHEKGKLDGLAQSHNTLREHSNILESALAKREADLVQLNLQVQAVLKRKEDEDQQMKQVVQTLQLALEKEKTKVHGLKEQVAAAKAEAAHNRRHYRAAMLELSEIKKDLQAKVDVVKALQSESHKLQAQDEQHSQEVSRFQEELAEAHSQLQILQKQLDEELAKQPLTNQEVEDLKWEVEQRQREIEAQKQQLEMMEQCQHRELDNLQRALQNIKVELESVQDDLSGTRKDKFMLQAKVGELRNSMKTVFLQNQQLKQDLKQSRLRKQRMELKSDGSPSNPMTPVKIPDCPVPASLLDELLKPSTSVNKEPLNNLHNCLRQLKEEMDSLQKQMEENTLTVHESMSSWTNTEEGLVELEIDNNISKSSTSLNNMVVKNNNEAEQQQS
ncbi:golgin subfamily A member 3 isoform X2 [Pseudoliparis swirei]|uniref:golgin subfamily A member 3 isoform X2 n=1 Tax=Pseudoliparis swirei TaxID=2059687 RepID=UPI0024BE9516|nr:golgin subfamily A member 3 isoform X2 [Pseudoliparis swirei]